MCRLLSLVAAAACLSGAAAQPPQFPRCGAAGDGAASAVDWPRATTEAPPDAWQPWQWNSAGGATLEQYTWVTWDGACATRQPCIVTLISSELDKVNSTLDSLACITTQRLAAATVCD
eukprot:COSAG04_NODE_1674_length_5968_cov_9.689726_2_plen_118_part_00